MGGDAGGGRGGGDVTTGCRAGVQPVLRAEWFRRCVLYRKSNSNEHLLRRVNRRRLVRLLTVSLGLATASCWSSDLASAPGDTASGIYRLTRFGGQSLPADVGRIVTRRGDTSYTDSCHLLVSGWAGGAFGR